MKIAIFILCSLTLFAGDRYVAKSKTKVIAVIYAGKNADPVGHWGYGSFLEHAWVQEQYSMGGIADTTYRYCLRICSVCYRKENIKVSSWNELTKSEFEVLDEKVTKLLEGK
jgi:hypothetical protein